MTTFKILAQSVLILQIYAATLTLPIIKIVYYPNGSLSPGGETALRSAVLIGIAIGQLMGGFFADIYGRKKLYGIELWVLLGAIAGVAMSSNGIQVEGKSSMDIFGWLLACRLFMGIGALLSNEHTWGLRGKC